MFQRKTTIVIGAGASKEVNLPTGKELKDRIAKILDIRFKHFDQVSGSYEIYEAIKSIANNEVPKSDSNHYLRDAWVIHDALPQAISIDNYIDAHQGNSKIEICGKLAIAESILNAERNSNLFFKHPQNNIDFSAIENTWFNSFMQLLTENCRITDIEQRLSTISLVIFNYDRCVEHFLFNALQNYYRISPDHAKNLLLRVNFFHPYGSIGDLPWMDNNGVSFGEKVSGHNLINIISKIKTFTEGTDPGSSQIKEIRRAIAESEILVFLGFAYHKQNLKLIKPTKEELESMPKTFCYGTSVGISGSDTKRIADELADFANLSEDRIALNNVDCARLFHEHWRSFSWD